MYRVPIAIVFLLSLVNSFAFNGLYGANSPNPGWDIRHPEQGLTLRYQYDPEAVDPPLAESLATLIEQEHLDGTSGIRAVILADCLTNDETIQAELLAGIQNIEPEKRRAILEIETELLNEDFNQVLINTATIRTINEQLRKIGIQITGCIISRFNFNEEASRFEGELWLHTDAPPLRPIGPSAANESSNPSSSPPAAG